jgi:peroxiredoxin
MRSSSRVSRMTVALMLVAAATLVFAGTIKKTRAPSFTLKNLKGENYVLEQSLGRGPIVINFWATWCGPCVLEMKNCKKIYETYASLGLQWIAISIDDNKTQPQIAGIIRSYKLPCTVLLDGNKEVYRAFKVANTPQLYVVDAEGMIVYAHQGYQKGDEKKVDAVIARLLSTKKQSPPPAE